jgi:hypothetical protein
LRQETTMTLTRPDLEWSEGLDGACQQNSIEPRR